MSWNPDTYLRFAEDRERPVHDLIARIPDAPVAKAADLGCGTGNSTKAFRTRFPGARFTGVDSSPQMLAKAKEEQPDVDWALADIETWVPEGALDAILSNAAYHWAHDLDALFTRLIDHLNEGGIFAFQVPANFDAPSHTLLAETARDGPWAARLKDVWPFAPMDTLETHYTRLAPLLSHVDLWETTYAHVLTGDDAVFNWVSGTALTAYLPLLESDEARAGFTHAYKARLRDAYPQGAGGKTVFPFRRIFVVGVK